VKTIVFEKPAAKEFDALPDAIRESIRQALDQYAILGVGDVRPLSGRKGFRLRVGDYRVLFDQDRQTIIAVYFGRRSTVTYRRN
jgi:mRNA interferase RelE/StbE